MTNSIKKLGDENHRPTLRESIKQEMKEHLVHDEVARELAQGEPLVFNGMEFFVPSFLPNNSDLRTIL